ncbi:sulfate adenylyltransferase subunit 2 [bacterium]|nr:sulfate adenylyltransferase subunit 2 [bacterium]
MEHEAIYYIREAVAQLERPALLFSGGKDSIVLAYLCYKAFHGLPCPLLHVDTGHNFPETLEFRDRFASQLGARLLIARVEDSIRRGSVQEEPGPRPSRNFAQSTTLKEAITEYRLDGLLGGGRRDEEKARAKERFFSHRDQHSQWKPKEQRPEFWSLVNAEHHPGEHFRIFPLSNWTELDVWRYIRKQNIQLPSLYFAHQRRVIQTAQGGWLAESPHTPPQPEEKVSLETVRFRTVGDLTCSLAVPSSARTLDEVIEEIRTSDLSERGGRADDQRSQAAMEDRKRLGYF